MLCPELVQIPTLQSLIVVPEAGYSVPTALVNLTQLTSLCCSISNAAGISSLFTQFQRLQSLNLTRSPHDYQLREFINKLVTLTHITLEDFSMGSLPQLFMCTQLTSISLIDLNFQLGYYHEEDFARDLAAAAA